MVGFVSNQNPSVVNAKVKQVTLIELFRLEKIIKTIESNH